MNKSLESHGPTKLALEVLVKARASGDQTAIHKGEISLIEALRSYVSSTSEFNSDGRDEAVIRLAAVILRALASSDFSGQFQSGSPAGSPVNMRVRKELVDPFGPEYDLKGIGAAIMRKAAAGLNVSAKFTRDTPQDLTGFENQRGGRVMKVSSAPRKATSPSDPTGD